MSAVMASIQLRLWWAAEDALPGQPRAPAGASACDPDHGRALLIPDGSINKANNEPL